MKHRFVIALDYQIFSSAWKGPLELISESKDNVRAVSKVGIGGFRKERVLILSTPAARKWKKLFNV
jgi:hypothetical protein